jgi:hypothetical protein
MRVTWPLVVLVLVCACHRRSGGPLEGASPASGDADGPLLFAPPIAAAALRSGAIMAVGVVPSRGSVAVARLGTGGATSFTVDAWRGVTPGANAELRAFPTPDGVAVVFRGRREDTPVIEAVVVSESGKVSGAPVDAGAAACATDDALSWIRRSKGGASSVLYAPWRLTPVSELLTVSPERDPMLVCGTRTIFALGDGERDTTVALVPSDSPRSVVAMRERDFKDEEREHDTFVVKDTLGLVRIGQAGSVAIREIAGEDMSAWHRFTTKLPEGDDVVAVDGDQETSLVVFTRDEAGTCDGPSSPSVHALTLTKATSAERLDDLEAAGCDREIGPFWTGAIGGSFVVAWVERSSAPAEGRPRVAGLSYRTLSSAGPGEIHRIARPSDELVDAGCDKDRCYAVALSSGKLEAFAYP